MNFELIDNCFQVAVLFCAALASITAAFRQKDRRFLILALFFLCVSMGTLYWVLHIFIFGNVPQVFYVSEFAWLAAYLFLLSFQMVRTDGVRPLFSLLPLFCALLTAAVVLAVRMFGPSYFVSAAFAVVFAAIVYLAACRLRRRGGGGLVDGWLLLCVFTFGIGGFFLEPYMQATYAEFYAAMRSKAFAAGVSDEQELGGFVRHD